MQYKFSSIINCFNFSDLLDVEKNTLGGKLTILSYNESVFFNHVSLLKQWFVAYKVGLYITVIYYMYNQCNIQY